MPSTDLVQVQFKDRLHDGYSGRPYTYIADVPLQVGDIVTVPTANGEGEARVCRVDVPDSDLPKFLNRDSLRHISDAATPGGSIFDDFYT